MRFRVRAACGCDVGKLRNNNEDNIYFDGKCLEKDNTGLENPALLEDRLKNGFAVAVFDGMGGEQFGEWASYVAAKELQKMERRLNDFFVSERTRLVRMAIAMDKKVGELQEVMQTEHIGTTFVGFFFFRRYIYICNVGDSRAYRLRDGELFQLSVDHIEKRPGIDRKKAPLTQYLGFGTDEIEISPYIAKCEIKSGDIYLLCSDGLTDMLSNNEITDILANSDSPEVCVRSLIRAANEQGGRDNISAIICKLIQER